MAALFGTARARAALGILFALATLASTAVPTAAAETTPYFAVFPQEVTTLGPCSPDNPTHICYTGQDHSGTGISIPPGGAATEGFSGFIDLLAPATCPDGSLGFRDTNIVTITTRAGELHVTTNGVACGLGKPVGSDQGTWIVTPGSTGIFAGVTGSGNVATVNTAPDPITHQIKSASVYTGHLTLPSGGGE